MVEDGTVIAEDRASVSVNSSNLVKEKEVKPRTVPPPGNGQIIYEIDPMLRSYKDHLDYRYNVLISLRASSCFVVLVC